MIEHIINNGQILAVIIGHDHTESGINFITQDEDTMQLAYMHHPAGKEIQPHVHNVVKRVVLYTKEILILKKGKIQTDFYTENQEYVCSRILETGDVVLLSFGGHGFKILEETEMYEIKQGPYVGESDKTRFTGKV
jgi:hypothetical protein